MNARKRADDRRREYEATALRQRELLRAAPEDLDALFSLGTCLLLLERLDEAAPVVETALRLAPDDDSILHLGGRLRTAQGRAAEALPLLEKALKALPRGVEYLAAYGDALGAVGRIDEAKEAYDAALGRVFPVEELYRELRRKYDALR